MQNFETRLQKSVKVTIGYKLNYIRQIFSEVFKIILYANFSVEHINFSKTPTPPKVWNTPDQIDRNIILIRFSRVPAVWR